MPAGFLPRCKLLRYGSLLKTGNFSVAIRSTTRAFAARLKIDLTEGAAMRLRSLPLFSLGIRLNTAHNASRLGVVGREVIRNKRCGSL
jgi:hypothetical protein